MKNFFIAIFFTIFYIGGVSANSCSCEEETEKQILPLEKKKSLGVLNSKNDSTNTDDDSGNEPDFDIQINYTHSNELKSRIKTTSDARKESKNCFINLYNKEPEIDLEAIDEDQYKEWIVEYYKKSLTCADRKFVLEKNKAFFIHLFGSEGFNTKTREQNSYGYGERTYGDTIKIWERCTKEEVDVWVWSDEELQKANETKPKNSKCQIRSIRQAFLDLEKDEHFKKMTSSVFTYFTIQRLVDKIDAAYAFLKTNDQPDFHYKSLKYTIVDFIRLLLFYVENELNKSNDLILTYSDFTNNPTPSIADIPEDILYFCHITTALFNNFGNSSENGMIFYNQKSTKNIFKDDLSYPLQLFPLLEMQIDLLLNCKETSLETTLYKFPDFLNLVNKIIDQEKIDFKTDNLKNIINKVHNKEKLETNNDKLTAFLYTAYPYNCNQNYFKGYKNFIKYKNHKSNGNIRPSIDGFNSTLELKDILHDDYLSPEKKVSSVYVENIRRSNHS